MHCHLIRPPLLARARNGEKTRAGEGGISRTIPGQGIGTGLCRGNSRFWKVNNESFFVVAGYLREFVGNVYNV